MGAGGDTARETKKAFLQRKRKEKQAKRIDWDNELDWSRHRQPPEQTHPSDQQVGTQDKGGRQRTTSCHQAEVHAWQNMVKAPADNRSGNHRRLLPRCDPNEVGWGAGGAAAMPTRPNWQGLASTAEELDALETEAFQQWEKGLKLKAAAQGADLSWYEGRIGFWRQLWRVLERSNVLLVLADARCPLYHLHPGLLSAVAAAGLPLVVVLNKEDLTPASAAAEWREYLSRLCGPNVKVVSAQARTTSTGRGVIPGANWEAARTIYEALLEVQVELDGGSDAPKVRVRDAVGCSAEEIMQRVYGKGYARRGAARGEPGLMSKGQGGDLFSSAMMPLGAMGSLNVEEHVEQEEEWDVKGTKARRRDAQRRRRNTAAGNRNTEGGRPGVGKDDKEGGDRGGANEALQCREGGSSDEEEEDKEEEGEVVDEGEGLPECRGRSSAGEGAAPEKGVVVVGVLGEPNVGKSSTVNALLGAHKVAVSSHPGKTRHYQTHYVPSTPQLMLCDCPGLVFPRLGVGLPLQTLYGSYPIARCRDPLSVVRFLAERVDPPLHEALRLQRSHCTDYEEGDEQEDGADDDHWSPIGLCEALAHKNKWRHARGGRLDVFRAANWLLRAALRGQGGLSVAFWPPDALPDIGSVMADENSDSLPSNGILLDGERSLGGDSSDAAIR